MEWINFEYAPGIISFTAFLVAARHIISGKFAPELVSRGIWMVLSALALLLLLQSSDSTAAVPLGVGLFSGSVLLFVLAFKASHFHWHRDDYVAIAGATIGLLVWLITGNPFIALLAILATDMMAFLPTYVKVWHTPLTEDTLFWGLLLTASVVSMFDLVTFREFEASNLVYNSYFLISQTAMLLFILWRRRKGQLVTT